MVNWRTAGTHIACGVIGGITALVGLHATKAIGAEDSIPNIVRAHEFQVCDELGKPVADLALNKTGAKLILMSDPGGLVTISTDADGGLIAVNDKDKKDEIKLGASEVNKQASMMLRSDPSGKVFLGSNWGLSVDGENPLMLLHGQQPRFDVIGESPSIRIVDERNQGRLVLGHVEIMNTNSRRAEARAPSSITLLDKAGRILWDAPPH